MLVQITRDTVAGNATVVAGQVVDLPDHDARTLVRMGKAVPVADAPASSDPVVPVASGKPGKARVR